MKKYFLILCTFTIGNVFSQNSDVLTINLLKDKTWEPKMVVELFNGQETVYSDSCLTKEGYLPLYGFWRVYPSFNENSIFIYKIKRLTDILEEYSVETKGEWHVQSNFLNIELENPILTLEKEEQSESPIFFGVMEVLTINDLELVVRKQLDRLGKWTRTFYFVSK